MVTAAVDQLEQPATPPFPPSGVVPFRGLVFYVAPFSYLFELPEKMYMCFRFVLTTVLLKYTLSYI